MTAPTDPIPDLVVTPIAELLLACFTETIATVPHPPSVVSLRPGDQVQLLLSKLRDECCEGLAWVRVAAFYPSANFPDVDGTYNRCAPVQWAVVLELGAARCAPIGTAISLPTQAQWTAVTLETLNDAAAMRRALCCLADVDPDRMWLAGQWTPLTVEGGCVGGTMTVTVAAGACDC